MINQQLKNYLASQPLKNTLKALVGLIKEVTGLKCLIITIGDDKKLTIMGTSGIITNEETVSILHDYFSKIENNFMRSELEKKLQSIDIKIKNVDDQSN